MATVRTPFGEIGSEHCELVAIDLVSQARFTFEAWESFSAENGAQRGQVMGRAAPRSNAGLKLEPKAEIKTSSGEVMAFRQSQGSGFLAHDVEVWLYCRVPGEDERTIRVKRWAPVEGGHEGEKGNPLNGTLGGKAKIVIENGIHPLPVEMRDEEDRAEYPT